MPMDASDPAYKGQRDFTPLTLRFYDPFVLSFSARWVWKCPVERLVENYRWHIRPNHLDVGPGTGTRPGHPPYSSFLKPKLAWFPLTKIGRLIRLGCSIMRSIASVFERGSGRCLKTGLRVLTKSRK